MKRTMYTALALLLALTSLNACGEKTPEETQADAQNTDAPAVEETADAAGETAEEAPAIEYAEEEDAFASFDFSTVDTSLKIDNFMNDWSGVVFGKTKKIAVENGVGYNGSKGLAVYSIGVGPDNDLDMKYENDPSAVIDWTGAEQIWYYVDGSNFGGDFYGNFAIQEQNADEDGTVNGSYQAWAVTEGVTAHIYDVNKNSGWEDVTCVTSANTTWDPGRIPLPAGFKGWVAIDVDSLTCYWTDNGDDADPINLVYMNQFNWSLEATEACIGHVCYLDSFSIVGKDVANGQDCPVAPMIDGAKWSEVWNFEGFVASDPENLDALAEAANKHTYEKIINDGQSVTSDIKKLGVVDGKGLNGSKALGVTAIGYGRDFDIDTFPTQDSTYISDWTGAEQIWFWLDAADYGTTDFLVGAAFAEESLNADGNLDGTSQAWCITEGAVAHLYDTNKNEGWTDVTCVNTTTTDWDPARITVPAGFQGWVAVDVATMVPYWANAEVPEVFDLKNVNQFNWCIETNDSAIGHTCYVDAYAIVGEAVNGGECPVPAMNANAKWLEVWGFEGIDAE